MILLGFATNPLDFCPLIKGTWSLNSLTEKIGVFIGLQEFTKLRQSSPPGHILIFDSFDKASSLEGLTYIEDLDAQTAFSAYKSHKQALKQTKLRLNPTTDTHIDPYILAFINKNKDTSLMHLYNTHIHRIKFKYTRDTIKEIFIDYLSGKTDRATFDKQIAANFPKRGETKDAVENLMKLTTLSKFMNLRSALQEVTKAGRDKVPDIAKQYRIDTFDLNYLLSQTPET